MEKVAPTEYLYAKAMERLTKRDEEYRAECDEYASQGLAPHYCIHGTNLWTDYDNICGGCESDITNEELARIEADQKWTTYQEAVNAALGLTRWYSIETITSLVNEASTKAGFPNGGASALYL